MIPAAPLKKKACWTLQQHRDWVILGFAGTHELRTELAGAVFPMQTSFKGRSCWWIHSTQLPLSFLMKTGCVHRRLLFAFSLWNALTGRPYPSVFGLDIRQTVFTVRVVRPWNRSPREAVNAPSVKELGQVGQGFEQPDLGKNVPAQAGGTGLDDL